MTAIRIRRTVLLLAFAFAGIAIRIGYLAVLQRPVRIAERALDDRRREWIPVPRAPILARGRDGADRILAEDLPAHDLGYRIEGVDPLGVAIREIASALTEPQGDPDEAEALRNPAVAGLPLALPDPIREALTGAVRASEDRLAQAVSLSRAWAEEEIDRGAEARAEWESLREALRERLIRPSKEDLRLRVRLLAAVPAEGIPRPLPPGISVEPEDGSLLPSRSRREVWLDPIATWGPAWDRLLRLDPDDGCGEVRRRIERSAADCDDPVARILRAAWQAEGDGASWPAWLGCTLDRSIEIEASVRILRGIPPRRLRDLGGLFRRYPRTFRGFRVRAERTRAGWLGRLFPRRRHDLWCDPRAIGHRERVAASLASAIPGETVQEAFGEAQWEARLDDIWAAARRYAARVRSEALDAGSPAGRARKIAAMRERAFLDYRIREKIWPIARVIPPDLVAAVICGGGRARGLEVTGRLRRSYGLRAGGARPGEIVAPLLGIADAPPDPPAAGDPPLALRGLSGLEAYYEERLRGRPGWREYEADSVVAESPPVPAPPLRLALDLDLQEAAWTAIVRAVSLYREKKGSIVVMDLASGGILACASYPSFDPNAYLGRDREELRRLQRLEKDSPLANHALLAYRPGSVFKLFIAAAALDAGAIVPATTHACAGLQDPANRCNNHGDAGAFDLGGAIERSCNEYFIHAGGLLGRERILAALPRFGLYRPGGTGIDLPERARPIPSARTLVPTFFSFGEGSALASPMEILRIVAAIALDGRAPVPRVALEGEPRSESFPIPPANARALREAMRRVVFGAHGTARDTAASRIGLQAFSVAAKTGTAEIRHIGGPPTNNAWIAGFAPFESPRLAFVVCLEDVDDGVHGGQAAGPVAAEILRALAAGGFGGLRREEVSP